MIWEGSEVKKVDLTVLDIGWTIIQKVCLYYIISVFWLYEKQLLSC